MSTRRAHARMTGAVAEEDPAAAAGGQAEIEDPVEEAGRAATDDQGSLFDILVKIRELPWNARDLSGIFDHE